MAQSLFPGARNNDRGFPAADLLAPGHFTPPSLHSRNPLKMSHRSSLKIDRSGVFTHAGSRPLQRFIPSLKSNVCSCLVSGAPNILVWVTSPSLQSSLILLTGFNSHIPSARLSPRMAWFRPWLAPKPQQSGLPGIGEEVTTRVRSH